MKYILKNGVLTNGDTTLHIPAEDLKNWVEKDVYLEGIDFKIGFQYFRKGKWINSSLPVKWHYDNCIAAGRTVRQTAIYIGKDKQPDPCYRACGCDDKNDCRFTDTVKQPESVEPCNHDALQSVTDIATNRDYEYCPICGHCENKSPAKTYTEQQVTAIVNPLVEALEILSTNKAQFVKYTAKHALEQYKKLKDGK